MIDELTLPSVRDVLSKLTTIKNIDLDDDEVTFQYKDKDGDNVTVAVKIDDDEKLFCMLGIGVPEEMFVTAIICANEYNSRRDTHGTFAYAVNASNGPRIVLESHILSRGGFTEDALRFNFKNFIGHINSFETIMIAGIKELGPDSSFLKSSGWNTLWEAAGAFFRGVVLAEQRS